jgi:hypothetical protein
MLLAIALLLAPTVLPPAALAADRPEAARCATSSLRQLVGEEVWSGAAAAPDSRLLPCDGTPVGPPPNPQVGDSWDWYIWRLNGFPQADLRSCTVRGMGPNCYVVVEDTQWNVNIDQTQVDTIVDHFENTSIGSFPTQGIWDLNTSHFGMPPDNLDADPRVYILYYDFDVSSDGFFWAFDQECDNVAAFHSNECDVVYMNCSDFDPAGSYLLAVLAHEFEHLIHYNHDPDEASWVDEGLAELAMWLYGDPDNISQFNTNPDRQLTTFNGAWADYIKTYLFTLYFYERYGGQPSVLSLVAEPRNGIAGYDTILDAFAYTEDFPDVFSDWVVANFLDDVSIGDGRFGYAGETMPPFNPFATFSSYPVGPNATSVNHWAADYVRYLNGSDFFATFDGNDTNGYAVRALLLDATSPTEVVDMTLDAANAGTLQLAQVGVTHDEVVMVHASIADPGGTVYSYGAGQGAVGAPALSPVDGGLALRVRDSGSAAPSFELRIPAGAAAASLEIYDVTGRRVLSRPVPAGNAGWRSLAWDGRDAAGALVGSGAYFARLAAGEERVVEKVVVRR